jgi:cell division protein FtsB
VSEVSVAEAIEAIYTSLHNDNEELDAHIAALKSAMAREGVKEATFETTKLAQPNRQGRKVMQSYFRKKGVTVAFI